MSDREEYEEHFSPDGEYLQYQLENPEMNYKPPFPLHVQAIIVKAKCGQDATYATLNHAQKKAVDMDVQSIVEAAVGTCGGRNNRWTWEYCGDSIWCR